MTLNLKEKDDIYDFYCMTGSLRKTAEICKCSPNTVRKYVEDALPIQLYNRVEKLNSSNDLLIGTYVGLWMGDGTQYKEENGKYTVKICCNKDDDRLNMLIQNIIVKLFGKKSGLIHSRDSKSSVVKLQSKFIFEFVKKYTYYERNKTLSVCLKDPLDSYSEEFLQGCLLGLMLSDGYMGEKGKFNVISENLMKNVKDILEYFGFQSNYYVANRQKYAWNDLYCLYLNSKETRRLKEDINSILKRIGCDFSVEELKYRNEPAVI